MRAARARGRPRRRPRHGRRRDDGGDGGGEPALAVEDPGLEGGDVAGEAAGSKLDKAESLGVAVIDEDGFKEMLS